MIWTILLVRWEYRTTMYRLTASPTRASTASHQGIPAFPLRRTAVFPAGYSRKMIEVAPARWIAPWIREGREPKMPV